MNLTAQQLALATGARIDRATDRLPAYIRALPMFNIDTRLRVACLLANVGHESGGFKYSSEIWGPTDQQRRYERDFNQPWPASPAEARLPRCSRNRLAYGLGNVERGDGEKFKGHGELQNTGRKNHAAARDRLRARFPGLAVPDFEAEPEALALPQWAAMSACDYVAMNNLNQYADVANFESYCDMVNRGRVTAELGDSNGFPQRLALFVAGMRYLL